MRQLSTGDIEAKLGRIRYSPRSNSWKKKARAKLLRDQGASEDGYRLTTPRGDVCTKRRFSGFTAAFTELIALQAATGPHRHEARVYPCGKCGRWHITSEEHHEHHDV